MQVRVSSILLVMILALPAFAAKRVTSDGHVAHSRRAPVAMHRMSPPYRGNHVYEKPPEEPRPVRSEREDRESSRRSRSSSASSFESRSSESR
jgi:hypothetical protein